MRILIILTILAGLLSCADGKKGSGITQFKLGHVAGPDSLITACADEFARRVNKKLAGRAEVQVFGSSQLGNDETLLQKLKLGTVDFSLPSTIMSSTVDAFGLFEMPYLVRDREHMKHIERAIFWPRIPPESEKKGYKLLEQW